MIRLCSSFTKRISQILLPVIFLNTFLGISLYNPTSIHAQNRPVVITADQPNIWTLEQAHYLLAQMHRRNLDLKARRLDTLDANAVNGTNIDILRTMLDVNATYDQGIGFDNKLTGQNKEFNVNRRQQLIDQQSRLNGENLILVRDIAKLDSQLKRLGEAKDGDSNEVIEERKEIGIQLDEKRAVQAVVKEQMSQNTEELKTFSGAAGDFKAATPPASSGNLSPGMLDKAIEKVVNELENKPSLNASLQLDNYLQMQYEILAKQLTLLRDEVGPGERLLFLEIPQSIQTTRGKADKKWGQTWFRIAGYTKPAPVPIVPAVAGVA